MNEQQQSAIDKLMSSLRQIYSDNMRVLDQQLLALSAGTLGLSLTFITDLIDLEAALILPVLIVGWIFLAGSVVMVVTGLRYATRLKTVRLNSDNAHQMAGTGEYKGKADPKAAMTQANSRADRIELYNKLGYWLFVAGLVLLMTFILKNVVVGEQRSDGPSC